MQEITIAQLKEAVNNNTLIVDARPTDQFVNGFIMGSINIVMNQHFEARVDFFSKQEKEFILVISEQDKEKINDFSEETKKKIGGLHTGTFQDWQENNVPVDLIISVDPYELRLDIKHDDKAIVLDVRADIQYNEEHIVGATNMPVNEFADPAKIGMLDEKHNLYLHCNGGTSSVLASSILKRNGFHNIRNIEGGIRAVVADGNIPLSEKNKKTQN